MEAFDYTPLELLLVRVASRTLGRTAFAQCKFRNRCKDPRTEPTLYMSSADNGHEKANYVRIKVASHNPAKHEQYVRITHISGPPHTRVKAKMCFAVSESAMTNAIDRARLECRLLSKQNEDYHEPAWIVRADDAKHPPKLPPKRKPVHPIEEEPSRGNRGKVRVLQIPDRHKRLKWPALEGYERYNVCRNSLYQDLSPMVAGPVYTTDGELYALTVEDAWQGLKVWPHQVPDHKLPAPNDDDWLPDWLEYNRRVRFSHGAARHRHDKLVDMEQRHEGAEHENRNARFFFIYWNGERLSYKEARRRTYTCWLAELVSRTPAFVDLQRRHRMGRNLLLMEHDGLRPDEDRGPLTEARLQELLEDDSRPFGHGLVLAAMLMDMPVWQYEPGKCELCDKTVSNKLSETDECKQCHRRCCFDCFVMDEKIVCSKCYSNEPENADETVVDDNDKHKRDHSMPQRLDNHGCDCELAQRAQQIVHEHHQWTSTTTEADFNAPNEWTERYTNGYDRLMKMAIEHGRVDQIRHLVQVHKERVNVVEPGPVDLTLLYWAIYHNRYDSIRTLYELGARYVGEAVPEDVATIAYKSDANMDDAHEMVRAFSEELERRRAGKERDQTHYRPSRWPQCDVPDCDAPNTCFLKTCAACGCRACKKCSDKCLCKAACELCVCIECEDEHMYYCEVCDTRICVRCTVWPLKLAKEVENVFERPVVCVHCISEHHPSTLKCCRCSSFNTSDGLCSECTGWDETFKRDDVETERVCCSLATVPKKRSADCANCGIKGCRQHVMRCRACGDDDPYVSFLCGDCANSAARRHCDKCSVRGCPSCLRTNDRYFPRRGSEPGYYCCPCIEAATKEHEEQRMKKKRTASELTWQEQAWERGKRQRRGELEAQKIDGMLAVGTQMKF